jgi:aromatic ring-opening dioxygenase catalytic subunit (LigB family)
MGEILGLGCTHAPMILNPAEQWPQVRKNIFGRIPNYQPPPKLLEELGDDEGATQDRINQQRIIDAFGVLREKLLSWNPDVILVVGDDQAENFRRENLPTFCLYTGSEVDGYPFHRPGGKVNLWNAPQDAKYSFKTPAPLARDMVAYLIRQGFDMSSATELKGWQWGLPHAHINPMMFLNQDGALPVLPLFVNCYGEEAGDGYPPRPTAQRCYELGRAIRRFLDTRSERVAVLASSSWSHGFLTHKYNLCQFDEEFDRRTLGWLKEGKGSKVAELTPEEIQQSGDHEFLNWVITLGVVGDKPAHIVDALDAQSQVSFKVFAIWE